MHSLLLPANDRPIAGVSQTKLRAGCKHPEEMRKVLHAMPAAPHKAELRPKNFA